MTMPAAARRRSGGAGWRSCPRPLCVTRLHAACARQRRAPRSAPESFAPLVKQVLPAVVNIAVTETVSGGDVLSELPPELRDTPLGREFRRRFGNNARSRRWAPARASSSTPPA